MSDTKSFDEGEIAWQRQPEPGRHVIADYAAPSITDDPLTRLWHTADDSRETGADAVTEMRERKRRAAGADARRRWPRG